MFVGQKAKADLAPSGATCLLMSEVASEARPRMTALRIVAAFLAQDDYSWEKDFAHSLLLSLAAQRPSGLLSVHLFRGVPTGI